MQFFHVASKNYIMVETQSRHSPPDCDDDKLIDLEVEQIKLKQHELEKIESTHEADDKKKKKKEVKKKEPSVMPHKLFRYASKFDLLAVILAAIGSIAIGALQPVAVNNNNNKDLLLIIVRK